MLCLNQGDSDRREDAEQHTDWRKAVNADSVWGCARCVGVQDVEGMGGWGEEPSRKYLIKYRTFCKYETINMHATFRHSPMARISACHAGALLY